MWIIWFFGLVIISAVLEGMLAAIMRLDKYELIRRARLGSERAQLIAPLRERGRELALLFTLGTVLSSLGALALANANMQLWSALLLTTLLIVFSQAIARSALRGRGYKVARATASKIITVLDILEPIFRPLSLLLMKPAPKPNRSYYSKEELIEVLSEHQEGPDTKLKQHDIDIAKKALTFSGKTADQIMTARGAITTIKSTTKFSLKTLDRLYKSTHQWFPVIDGNTIDECIGVINLSQAMSAQTQSETASQLDLSEVLYIPKETYLPETLAMLRETNSHMGLVVDEHMQVEGLVTLDDIITELVPYWPNGE